MPELNTAPELNPAITSNRFAATPSSCRFLAVVCWMMLAIGPPAQHVRGADDAALSGSAAPAAATIPALEARLQRIRESKDIDASHRDELVETNTKAIEQLRAADEFAVKSAEWVKISQSAPGELERVKGELERISGEASAGQRPAVSSSGGLTQMQQSLAQAEAYRDHLRKQLEELNDERERRAERRHEIAVREGEIETELREVEEALDRDHDDDDETASLARQTLLHARRRTLGQEQEMHRQELLAFEATADLVTAQCDLAAIGLQAAEDLLDAWQKGVNDVRRSEADRLYAQTRERVDTVHPALRPMADANVELAAGRRDLALRIEETIAESEAASTRLAELQEQFEKVSDRARKIGFTEAIGLLLRTNRAGLTVIDDALRNKHARAADVAQLNVLLSDYEEQRSKLADLNARVRVEMSSLHSAIPEAEQSTAQRDLRELLETRRSCLDALIRDTSRYVDELMELETIERQLVECVREFATFSDEHSLWIRSTGFPQPADVDRLRAAGDWLVRPAHWTKACHSLADDANAHTGLYAAVGMLLTALALGRWRLRRLLSNRRRINALHAFAWNAAAGHVAIALLAAAWWPLVMAFIGARLSLSPQADEFVAALGRSLKSIVLPWLMLAYVGKMSRGSQAAASLFGCDDRQLKAGRLALKQGMFAALPLVFLVLMTEAQAGEGPRNTIGRLAFGLLMGVCAGTVWRLGRAAAADASLGASLGDAGIATAKQSSSPHLSKGGQGGSRGTGMSNDQPAAWRLRRANALHWLILAVPIGLAVASIAGYHHTAIQLARRTLETMGFFVALVTVHALCSLWVRLSNRNPASVLKKGDRHLATLEIQRLSCCGPEPVPVFQQPATSVDDSEASPLLNPAETDLSDEIAAQSADAVGRVRVPRGHVQRLLRLATLVSFLCGVAAIWSGVFPALKFMRSVELWPQPFRWVDPAMVAEDAAKIVTLAGLLAALGIAALTLAAARNIRAALELTIFRRIALDTGARYAVTAICRYVIGVAGLFASCAHLGIGWAQLNWLVAAMTVGLGFGMQEIFANFVSGLILLFERPVRIGDIVSVEGVTGTVSRIRIRATTITDGDMRELIVPNKELITGRVINWTLSNTVARMTIVVRTAHGVDPDKARNLLLAVAVQHPLVLKQPPPHALFDEFSDKTQNFTLRVYMASCDVYAPLRHELLTGIQRSFRQAGIGLNSSDAASLPIPVPPHEQRAA